MSGTRVRSPVVLLALIPWVYSATAGGIGAVQAPANQPSVTTDVVYGHKDGLALTLDVHRPARPNGAGIISIVSGGWHSSVEMAQIFTQAYPPLNEKGFTVFAVRHGSWPRIKGRRMYAALTKAGVPASFIRITGAEHGFAGAAPADLERANAALLQWFERHLGTGPK